MQVWRVDADGGGVGVFEWGVGTRKGEVRWPLWGWVGAVGCKCECEHIRGVARKCRYGVLMRMEEGWVFLNGVLGHERAGYGGLCGVGWMRWDANVNVSTFRGLHESVGMPR